MLIVHKCQSCGTKWDKDALKEIKDIFQRVAPGEPMPSGECPDCGALCHPIEIPWMLDNPSFGKLKEAAQQYINALATDDHGLDNYKQHVFEEAITTCFGEDVWTWINKKLDER